MNKLVRAMDFACRVHAKDRYGEFPYVRHLAHVALVLAQFNFTDEDLLSAAWLHDAIEDQDIAPSVITKHVGQRVSDLVWAVTGREGKNRSERLAAHSERCSNIPTR